MANKRSARLQTVGDCCHELARVYNKLKREEIDIAQSRALANILNILLNGLIKTDLEKRLTELEDKLTEMGK